MKPYAPFFSFLIDIKLDFCKSLKQKGHDVKLCIIGEVTEAIIDKLKISNKTRAREKKRRETKKQKIHERERNKKATRVRGLYL